MSTIIAMSRSAAHHPFYTHPQSFFFLPHFQNLTATVRKKESALDERPSAQSVGYLGVVMLCLSGVIIIVMDANYIVEVTHLSVIEGWIGWWIE